MEDLHKSEVKAGMAPSATVAQAAPFRRNLTGMLTNELRVAPCRTILVVAVYVPGSKVSLKRLVASTSAS